MRSGTENKLHSRIRFLSVRTPYTPTAVRPAGRPMGHPPPMIPAVVTWTRLIGSNKAQNSRKSDCPYREARYRLSFCPTSKQKPNFQTALLSRGDQILNSMSLSRTIQASNLSSVMSFESVEPTKMQHRIRLPPRFPTRVRSLNPQALRLPVSPTLGIHCTQCSNLILTKTLSRLYRDKSRI